MQRPRKFDEEGALWTEAMIAAAHRMQITQDKIRTVIAIDPATTSSDESDETGIVACSAYGGGKYAQYSVDGDYSGRMSPNDWAQASMNAYNIHEADAIVIETNQGGKWQRPRYVTPDSKAALLRCTQARVNSPAPSQYRHCMHKEGWPTQAACTRWKIK